MWSVHELLAGASFRALRWSYMGVWVRVAGVCRTVASWRVAVVFQSVINLAPPPSCPLRVSFIATMSLKSGHRVMIHPQHLLTQVTRNYGLRVTIGP
jgi:hypothetical protein